MENFTKVRVKGKRKTSRKSNLPKALLIPPLRTKPRGSLASVLASRRPPQRLDELPAEILEMILLYSTNLSLPRVSHQIGVRLSGRATLLRLFIQAFHETWDQWFGIPTDPAIVNGPWLKGMKMPDCRGDYVLQSEVLDQPWANIDLILQAQQTWANRYGCDRWYQHSSFWDEPWESVGHDHEGGRSHFNAAGCFEVDYQQACKWPAFRVQTMSWFSQDIHPMTRIPTKLVTGPWDDEMQRRLFWLCRGGFMVRSDATNTLTWEVKIDCLRNAVLSAPEPNILVINCLMRSWIFTDLPADVVRKELLIDLERRLEWGGDTIEVREVLGWTRSALYLSLDLPDVHLLR